MIYVTDMHPLVFWSSDRKNPLGKRARKIFQEVEQGKHSIVVPLVVLEETARLIERKVVRLSVPFRRWAEELDRSANFQVQPYTIEILPESVSLGAIRDPADKAIVASARQLRCRSSQRMSSFGTAIGSIRCGIELPNNKAALQLKF